MTPVRRRPRRPRVARRPRRRTGGRRRCCWSGSRQLVAPVDRGTQRRCRADRGGWRRRGGRGAGRGAPRIGWGERRFAARPRARLPAAAVESRAIEVMTFVASVSTARLGLTARARASNSSAASLVGSGSSGYSCSPETPSAARLVRTSRERSAAPANLASSGETAGTRCSTLSSSTRHSPSRSRCSTSSSYDRAPSRVARAPGRSWRRRATVPDRGQGDELNPVSKRGAIRAASSSASRLLPLPPGPVIAISRLPAPPIVAASRQALGRGRPAWWGSRQPVRPLVDRRGRPTRQDPLGPPSAAVAAVRARRHSRTALRFVW